MKNFGLIIIFLLLANTIKAQYYPVYSQYMFNGLALNPAYAGSRDALSVNLLYRNQWTGMEGAPQTSTLSIHSPLKNDKVALGLQVYRDKLGVTGQTGMLGSYAYRIQTGKGKLSLGLQGGVVFQQNNWDQIHTTQPGDPVFSGNYQVTIPQAGAGIYYYTARYFAGFSVPQLLIVKRNPAFFNKDIRNKNYFFTAGYTLPLTRDFRLKPSFLLRCSGRSRQIDINTWLSYRNKMSVGVSYRSSEAWVFLVAFQANRQLSFGYSYDRSFNNISSNNNGSHEIVITYDFRYTVRGASPRTF